MTSEVRPRSRAFRRIGHRRGARAVLALLAAFAVGCSPAPSPPPPPSGSPTGEAPAETASPSPWATATHTSTATPRPRPTVVPGRHGDGDCLAGRPGTIIGTSGNDTIRGTAKAEHICGLGGDDEIIGGGGQDKIFGGPGDDHLVGGSQADALYGQDGDDVLEGRNDVRVGRRDYGVDELYGDWSLGCGACDDSGDDVLKGGTHSMGERMVAGPGNDVLIPTVDRTYGHQLNGGDGKDVVVEVNYSTGANTDVVDLNGEYDASLPLGTYCVTKVQLRFPRPGDKVKRGYGELSCGIPWGDRLEGLNRVLPVTGTLRENGDVEVESKLVNDLAKVKVTQWRAATKVQASFAEDVCLCDPLTDNPYEMLGYPYDYSF